MNAYADMPKEDQDISMLQEVINKFNRNREASPISELFLQLERESSNQDRKNLLLHVLTDQSYHPDDMERDAVLQKQLQLSKAELGYLLHLEEFEKNFEKSVDILHEGIVCLGSSKSDCLDLLEKIREQYCKILEKLPELQFQSALKRFPNIYYDIHKIVRLFNNKLNPKNVLLGEMLVIMGQLQKFEKSINPSGGIETLEITLDRLASLGWIDSITKKWKSWIYSELIQIVSREAILDSKYFIDRKEGKRSLEDFYLEVINGFNNINLFGPRGIGVSSLMKQCYQVYFEKTLAGGNIFLYLDGKEISTDNATAEFSKKIYDQIHQGIKRINGLGFLWGADLLENIKSFDESLNYLNGLRSQKVHLFFDHYEIFHEKSKDEIDKILHKLSKMGIHLVIGSETAIQVEYVKFSTIELVCFTENEVGDYLISRLKYKENILQVIPVKEVYKLTGGIPALLPYMVEYILKEKSFDFIGAKIKLMNEAKSLFDHWELLWGKKLYREDNAAYRSYINDKNGEPDQNLRNYIDEMGAKVEAKTEGKIEAAKVEINAGMDVRFVEVMKVVDMLSKNIYISRNHLENERYIDLNQYQKSFQWKEEAEVNMAEFGMPEDIWEVIKREEDVYQYIKYGEALRRFTHNIHQPNYDYSVFALNYCLAFELISNKMLKGFFVKKMPEKDVTICRIKGITKLKDSRDTTIYTVGSYDVFLTEYKNNYQDEFRNIGFDFYQFCKAYKDAKNIRNKVAHVGEIIDGDQFSNFLSLLFGVSNKPVGQPSVFEGILRLVNQ